MKIFAKSLVFLVLACIDAQAAVPPHFNLTPVEIVASINQKMRAITEETNTKPTYFGSPEITSDTGGKKIFSSTYFDQEKHITTLLMFVTDHGGKYLGEVSVVSMSAFASASPAELFIHNEYPVAMLIQTLDPKGSIPKTRAHSGDILNEMIGKMKHMRNGRLSVSSDNLKYKLEISETNTQTLGKLSALQIDVIPLH